MTSLLPCALNRKDLEVYSFLSGHLVEMTFSVSSRRGRDVLVKLLVLRMLL